MHKALVSIPSTYTQQRWGEEEKKREEERGQREKENKEVGHPVLAKPCLCTSCTGVCLMSQLLLRVLSGYQYPEASPRSRGAYIIFSTFR